MILITQIRKIGLSLRPIKRKATPVTFGRTTEPLLNKGKQTDTNVGLGGQ